MTDTPTRIPKPEKRALAAFEMWRKLMDHGPEGPPLPATVAETERTTAELLGYETVKEMHAAIGEVWAYLTDPARPPRWYDRLNQGEAWWDAKDQRHEIAEMPATYRAAVVAFLRRRAVGLEFAYGWGEALSIGAYEGVFGVPDDFDIPTHDMDWPTDYTLTNPEGRARHEELCLTWLEGTRLVRSLRAGHDVRYGDEPEELIG